MSTQNCRLYTCDENGSMQWYNTCKTLILVHFCLGYLVRKFQIDASLIRINCGIISHWVENLVFYYFGLPAYTYWTSRIFVHRGKSFFLRGGVLVLVGRDFSSTCSVVCKHRSRRLAAVTWPAAACAHLSQVDCACDDCLFTLWCVST